MLLNSSAKRMTTRKQKKGKLNRNHRFKGSLAEEKEQPNDKQIKRKISSSSTAID
jgi:hypothetical protein